MRHTGRFNALKRKQKKNSGVKQEKDAKVVREMKSFTERVKRNREKQGLHIFRVSRDIVPALREPIDLIAIKNGEVTFYRARGNGHGNLNATTILRLQMLGKKCGAKVLYAKENGEGEIVFFRVYKRRKGEKNENRRKDSGI